MDNLDKTLWQNQNDELILVIEDGILYYQERAYTAINLSKGRIQFSRIFEKTARDWLDKDKLNFVGHLTDLDVDSFLADVKSVS